MEEFKSINSLSNYSIDSESNVALKNKLINNDSVVTSKEEIISSAKYDPEEKIHREAKKNDDEDDDEQSNKTTQNNNVNNSNEKREEMDSKETKLTPKNINVGGSEQVLVNKVVNNLKDNAGLGSIDSLSRKKLHMNKKFQELRDSQATLNKVMSTEDQIYKKKNGNNLSDDALNIKAKSKESVNDSEEEKKSDNEFNSDDDEIFDIEVIRKFEKRNTIHVPLHKRNYNNINSSYLQSSFYNIKITEGIGNIIKQLFEVIEENIRPIMQCDDMSKIFLKAVTSVGNNKKEEEEPDFDITTISDDITKLVQQYKFEEAYNLINSSVNNNYRVQICEEIITTINSIIVLFCLEVRVQTHFREFYTKNYSNIKRDSLLEIMNAVDYISPPEKIILGYCVYYLINSKNKKLAPETYKELSSALTKNADYNYALHVLNDMGRQHWDKKTYQNALDLCIKMKPQKLEYAESLLNDYGKPYIVAKNENSLVPIIISTPLMIGTTEQEIKSMRNYYKELLRQFKWKNALEDFETAKHAIYTKKEMLQLKNAMLELCVTYKEFQHGWSIFQGMTDCNKITAQVAITLCREAINYYNEADEQDTYRIGWINRAWDIAVSLKDWAIYNMQIIHGKKNKSDIKKNKKNTVIISDILKEKLKDYKHDKNTENEEQMNGQNPPVETKRKKSLFQSNSKPAELPSHLAKSNFNFTNIDRNGMISIIAFVFHEILCTFETVPNMEIFLLHVIEIYNFLTEYNIVEILCDEYMIRPLIRYCLKCRLGEKYKKFNFNTLPKEDSEREATFNQSSAISDEELRANIEKMSRRRRSLSVNKNQQMNDILFEHIKNSIKNRVPETTPEDPEFNNEKNQICSRIAIECYYNICSGNTETHVSKCHSNTYAMILHFAILGDDQRLFETICNDLWYARIQLDEEVVMALQLFHDFHLECCKNCNEKDHFYSAEVSVQPYKYEKQKFIVLNGIRMRTPLDLSFLKKVGTINGRPYSQEEARDRKSVV